MNGKKEGRISKCFVKCINWTDMFIIDIKQNQNFEKRLIYAK